MDSKLKNIILDILETLILSAITILIIYKFIGSLELVYGSSMEPNFHTGERVLVDRIFREFKRGDVVVLYPPEQGSKHYIKRIIGMPGDIIKVYNCRVYITRDNKRFIVEEPYLKENTCTYGNSGLREGRAFRIPEGEYIVFGDNRENSMDSRMFGTVKESAFLGKAVFRFWPPKLFGFLNSQK